MKNTKQSELFQNKNEGKIDNPQSHTQDGLLFGFVETLIKLK